MNAGPRPDLTELSRILSPDRVLTRYIDRIAFANDASVYRLVPAAVVLPTNLEEVRRLFELSRARRIPLTFRTAGTSLSGQAVTDGILAVLSRHWRELEITDDGRRVRVQPGVIGGRVNDALRPYGAKIGPDPASIQSCMMGGILANNSSGMCCGVVQNAYHTLESMIFVLPDGTVVDSSRADADAELRRARPQLAQGLLDLKQRIERDGTLTDRIRTKYRMKNTTGYSLNAFLDYASPVDILTHLMIGSEGTLGFIAEARLNTVPDYPFKYTGLLFFPDVPSACAAIAPLRDSGARALELMDRASLRAIQDQPGAPPGVRDLSPLAAALLVEYQCDTERQLEQQRRDCDALVPGLPQAAERIFTHDPAKQAELWQVRKGLIPSVGAMRRRGTSFIIEDVVFPVEHLARGVSELQALFARHGYDDAILFGHAKDGNLHFVLTQAFDREQDVECYDAFMHDLSDLVAGRYGGALKAEHGTGRNMAPFVEAEWGGAAYQIMQALKQLVDPDGLLNPGVILNEDPRAHVTHLKSLPTVEAEVDACIECGFCERMCPSRDLTLTPRQRIVVRREMSRLRESQPDAPLLRELERDYGYAAVTTCAADGLCATACPVDIDTGLLVKRLRRESRSDAAHEVARILADRFGLVERGTRFALTLARTLRRTLGDTALSAVLRAARLPIAAAELPDPAATMPANGSRDSASAVYFPACVSRVLGRNAGDPDSPALPEQIVRVAARAGSPVWIPPGTTGHCCGLAFGSKGFDRAAALAANRTVHALWTWSDRGRLPIVIDASPCALSLKRCGSEVTPANRERLRQMRILDSIEFAADRVVPQLTLDRMPGEVALHPVCSVRKMNLSAPLQRVAEACAEEVYVPAGTACCGFSGDRGFSVPELTAAATRPAAAELSERSCVGYYSTSRTCEIGMSRATGKPFRSIWALLERASRATITR